MTPDIYSAAANGDIYHCRAFIDVVSILTSYLYRCDETAVASHQKSLPRMLDTAQRSYPYQCAYRRRHDNVMPISIMTSTGDNGFRCIAIITAPANH